MHLFWSMTSDQLHPACREMQTSVQDVYAAGDACCTKWPDQSQQWFQMRLWTQASAPHIGLYQSQRPVRGLQQLHNAVCLLPMSWSLLQKAMNLTL